MARLVTTADRLRMLGKLGPYTTTTTKTPVPAMAAAAPDPSAVRAWAAEEGIEVSARGRIPAHVLDAYTSAHQKTAP